MGAREFPFGLVRSEALSQQGDAPLPDGLPAMRAQLGALPIQVRGIGDNLMMLSGPGGNVVVCHGPDGKILIDSFVQPAWPSLEQFLDELGTSPITYLVNTHWHFDHSDNNENLFRAGAEIVAHEYTGRRLRQSHEFLGMHFDPAPSAAQPTRTFLREMDLYGNHEEIEIRYAHPAHTDGDIQVFFVNSNVLHLGDLFFNGSYPVIDWTTGGNINGLVDAIETAWRAIDNDTTIIPGHGPLGDKSALSRYRDVIRTTRDVVQFLQSSGKTRNDVLRMKPTESFDAEWGKGFVSPEDFVTVVYDTL